MQMKTHIHTFITILFLGIFLPACQKEKTADPEICGQLVHHTNCKNFFKNADAIQAADSISCVEYSYEASGKQLVLKHINAGFNCCPDYLYCTVHLKNDTIIIREHEASSLCDCSCLYDLDMEISGVQARKYQVRFIEPYAGNQEELVFEMDLSEGSSGSFCVTRKLYPWGVSSMAD